MMSSLWKERGMAMHDVTLVRGRRVLRWFIVFTLAWVMLLVCSKNSLLYPGNDWADINCFMTVARAMKSGSVLYHDIYEQKGPWLYFIYWFLSWFSEQYWPVYALEVVTYSAFLYIAWRLFDMYIQAVAARFCCVVVTACLPLITRSFFHGGSVEECLLFAMLLPMYLAARGVLFDAGLSRQDCIICGVCCGLCFWIKYTLCGFFLGLCLAILIYDLFRKTKRLMYHAGWFLAGFGLISIPVFVYFIYHNVLVDLWRCYFYNNIVVYMNGVMDVMSGATDVERTWSRIWLNVENLIDANSISAMAILAGLLWFLSKDNGKAKETGVMCLPVLGLVVSTCGFGVPYCYYAFVFTVFLPLGLIAVVCTITKRFPWVCNVLAIRQGSVLIYFTAICVFLCCLCSKNLYYLQYWEEPRPQALFGDIIQAEHEGDSPLVLQYMSLDMGFMLEAEAQIPEPYFCVLNADSNDGEAYQTALINDGMADYIVTVGCPLEMYQDVVSNLDTSGYQLRQIADGYYWNLELVIVPYYLYERANAV